MAFTISADLAAPAGRGLAVVAGLPRDEGRPPMPTTVRGRLAAPELTASVRGAAFVLDYRSRIRPGPRAELRGRVVPRPDGGARVEARVGLTRWMTTYNGWIVAALALPFAWQGSWGSAALVLAIAGLSTAVNRAVDAGITRSNDEARYLTDGLEHALAALGPLPGPEPTLQQAAT